MAKSDLAIANDQVTQANDQLQISNDEMGIAQAQASQAQRMKDLLANQFTNAALYSWMSGQLAGVYRFFLQQATSTARLAQEELSFERQAPLFAVIQADYWSPPTSQVATTPSTDWKGMTAAERLLQDLYQLDQLAMDTNRQAQPQPVLFSGPALPGGISAVPQHRNFRLRHPHAVGSTSVFPATTSGSSSASDCRLRR